MKVALSPAVIEGEGDFAGLTGAVPGLFPVPTQKRSKDEMKKGTTAAAAGSIVFALIFNMLLFVAAPLLLTNALFIAAGWATTPAAATSTAAPASSAAATRPLPNRQNEAWYTNAWSTVRTYLHPVRPSVAFNLIDGLIRMTFFLIMIFSFSLLKDIRRVFQYHGAEHKTVFTWEAGLPLTVENARPQPRQHPRCGTSFLMVVMLVSIVLFSVIKFDSLFCNFLIRIALMPVVAGLSYEIIRLSAKKESGWFFKLMTQTGRVAAKHHHAGTGRPATRSCDRSVERIVEAGADRPAEPLPGAAVMTAEVLHVRQTGTNRSRYEELTQELSSPELLVEPFRVRQSREATSHARRSRAKVSGLEGLESRADRRARVDGHV